jgi:hypothetical protein
MSEYVCQTCNKSFSSKGHLDRHLKKKIKCEQLHDPTVDRKLADQQALRMLFTNDEKTHEEVLAKLNLNIEKLCTVIVNRVVQKVKEEITHIVKNEMDRLASQI